MESGEQPLAQSGSGLGLLANLLLHAAVSRPEIKGFQLECSGLRCSKRIDRLLVVVAIAVLISHLQGYAVSQAGKRRRVDLHWNRGLSFARIGLHWIQQSEIGAGRMPLAWIPIPLQALEPCVSAGGRQVTAETSLALAV